MDFDSQVVHSKTAEAVQTQPTVDDFLRQRASLFRRAEHYFDPFASPILFFRSAGSDVPAEQNRPFDDMDELAALEREDFFQQQLALSHVTGWNEAAVEHSSDQAPSSRRRASRRYPSNALGLRLPPFYISAGNGSAVNHQATELAQLLRRIFERRNKSGFIGRSTSPPDMSPALASGALVRCVDHPGFAAWDTSDAGRRRMREASRWMASVLDGNFD